MSLFPSVFGRNHPGALKGEIDRVFDDFFAGFPAMAGFAAGDNGYMPALDLKETKEGLELTADLPDMKKEDINLEVQQDRLVLSGMRKQEHPQQTKAFMSESVVVVASGGLSPYPLPLATMLMW